MFLIIIVIAVMYVVIQHYMDAVFNCNNPMDFEQTPPVPPTNPTPAYYVAAVPLAL